MDAQLIYFSIESFLILLCLILIAMMIIRPNTSLKAPDISEKGYELKPENSEQYAIKKMLTAEEINEKYYLLPPELKNEFLNDPELVELWNCQLTTETYSKLHAKLAKILKDNRAVEVVLWSKLNIMKD